MLIAIVAAGCDRDTDRVAGPSAPKAVRLDVTAPATGNPQVAAGAWHTCALRAEGTIACWGNNNEGEASPPSGTYTQIDAGSFHTCAVSSAGEIACWGQNTYGETNVPAATAGLPWVQAAAGSINSCGLRSDGSLVCWGNSLTGVKSTPTGSYTQVSVGEDQACAIRTDGMLVCWGSDNTLVSGAPTAPTGHHFTQVSAGKTHDCALADDGSIQCWGSNATGQLDVPALPAGVHYTQVSVSFNYRLDVDPAHVTPEQYSCALRSDGTAVCWGNNHWGQLNVPPLPAGATYTNLSAGLWQTCAARSDGVVACTGNNWEGQISVPATLNLLKRTQPIVFTPAVPNPAVLGKLFKPVPNVGSGNPVVFNSLTPAVCIFTSDPQPYLWFSAEGTCSFSADRAGNDQYEPSPQLIVTVTIALGTQTITFTSSAPNPAHIGDTYTVSATGGDSFNEVTFSSLTTATCTVAGNTVSFVAVGTCTVAADQAGAVNYHAAPQVTQAITVVRRPQTLSFTLPSTGVMGSPLTLSATGGGSGNPVTFTALTPSTCTLSGNQLSLTSAGTCTVAADQAGNTAYDAAPRVTASVAVRWPFTGFVGLLAPPAVNGSIKAGSTVRMTFSLGGNRGTSVLAGSPTVAVYQCKSTPLPTPGAGSPNVGTLDYNATTQEYTYNYVTLKSRASKTCVQFSLMLADGSIHTALFQFK